jgi:hypothetical protein
VLALGTNAALGAFSAGITRAIRGDSFWVGFSRGAAGGGLSYLGKYMATGDIAGVELFARQATALGASITHNAITGQGTFETLTFPLGPLRIHRSPAGPRLTVDLLTVGGTIYGLSRPGAKLDLGRSLATGTIHVEVARFGGGSDGERLKGKAVGGTVLYRREDDRYHRRVVITHEMIHVLQHDFAAVAFSSPFEGWLAARLPAQFAKPLQYLDLGSYAAVQMLPMIMGMKVREIPWEREAYFLVPSDHGPGWMHIMH